MFILVHFDYTVLYFVTKLLKQLVSAKTFEKKIAIIVAEFLRKVAFFISRNIRDFHESTVQLYVGFLLAHIESITLIII
jgi:hypothetical protein